eukprot:CAMPEP_0181214470 /NCGR_PEP_ID=MMETSP1096-20121128/25473_1 /TAXON_ID=156174 ORGANISM="Chrysochromulina ericina, Strain CCMP281" /NCGR_SAMPLE_ID=MMETSP1096 /ASSEMBLY_ACC=CAM_ASM_000453 /LENGTH=107 /DNA_ID=CAMNT_0023306213 /DNA_START=871 /DNA_END=1195 /DNA_ORIENTATION=-
MPRQSNTIVYVGSPLAKGSSRINRSSKPSLQATKPLGSQKASAGSAPNEHMVTTRPLLSVPSGSDGRAALSDDAITLASCRPRIEQATIEAASAMTSPVQPGSSEAA